MGTEPCGVALHSQRNAACLSARLSAQPDDSQQMQHAVPLRTRGTPLSSSNAATSGYTAASARSSCDASSAWQMLAAVGVAGGGPYPCPESLPLSASAASKSSRTRACERGGTEVGWCDGDSEAGLAGLLAGWRHQFAALPQAAKTRHPAHLFRLCRLHQLHQHSRQLCGCAA